MNTSVVKKWASCTHSVAYGFGGEDGYALREKGYNENYGCLQPDVIDDTAEKGSFSEDDRWISVAVLHGIGRFDDLEVIEALTETCGGCKYYQKR